MSAADFLAPQPASGRQLAMATAIAAAVAAALLFTVVLPAEYGIDPLGTGRALGLVRDDADPLPPLSVENAMVPVQTGPLARFGAPYRRDDVAFELEPYQFVEYKYHLAERAGLVFSWAASAPLMYDFHGAPDGASPESEVSVDRQTSDRAAGSLVAPFTGMHGWYWENPGGRPITIRLTSAGFYSAAIEYRSDGQRLAHELAAPESSLAAPER